MRQCKHVVIQPEQAVQVVARNAVPKQCVHDHGVDLPHQQAPHILVGAHGKPARHLCQGCLQHNLDQSAYIWEQSTDRADYTACTKACSLVAISLMRSEARETSDQLTYQFTRPSTIQALIASKAIYNPRMLGNMTDQLSFCESRSTTCKTYGMETEVE